MIARKIAKTVGFTAAAASVVACAACALVAPRRADHVLKAQWKELARHRYCHRGLHDNSGPAPENSLAAFRLAAEAGYGSELDVHLTADDELVIIHDSSTLRACGVEGTIEHLSLMEICKLRLFDSDEGIPTFEDVLKVYEELAPGLPLVVEVKTYDHNWEAVTKRTLEMLDAHNVPYCMESFDPRVLWYLRKWRPGVIRGQLSEDFIKHGDLIQNPRVLLAHSFLLGNAAARPDFIAYRYEDLDNPMVRLATGPLGAPLVVWTVRDEDQLADCDARGAVSIFEGFTPSALV